MTSLPVLKRVSSLPTNILDRILLTHMLYEMRYSGSVCRSQRYYGQIFNRIDSARFSSSRRSLSVILIVGVSSIAPLSSQDILDSCCLILWHLSR